MLYTGYELNRRAGAPVATAYGITASVIRSLPHQVSDRRGVRGVWAAFEVLSRARATHTRPPFGIHSVFLDGQEFAVQERSSEMSPFATMIHFSKPSGPVGQPKVLVVGPLSGHFTTLIRPTIRTLLAEHDVHVLDWINARDVHAAHGAFGLDDYVEHVKDALHLLGPDTHVVAVCQPAVPVLTAVAVLAADEDDAQPATLTLIAGPIDTRVNPNRVNDLANSKPLAYFEKHVIDSVPSCYPGAGRRVYPGFVQLAAFMSMNPRRHVDAYVDMYRSLVVGDNDKAESTMKFYDEYGAVMDVHADFYLETVDQIFQRHLLARGEQHWRGHPVDPGAIRRTALLTVEGANDDICSPGQTLAAHDLCSGIPSEHKRHHLQPGVGHYGVFSGSRWEAEIYPVIRDFIASHETALVAMSSTLVDLARRHSLGDLPRRTAQRTPHKLALVDGETRLTFAELESAVDRAAGALAASGLVQGDRLAILSHNCWQFVVLSFAIGSARRDPRARQLHARGRRDRVHPRPQRGDRLRRRGRPRARGRPRDRSVVGRCQPAGRPAPARRGAPRRAGPTPPPGSRTRVRRRTCTWPTTTRSA